MIIIMMSLGDYVKIIFFEWYEGYQERQPQKAKIKEELLPISCHHDRVKDWCLSEDEKRRWK